MPHKSKIGGVIGGAARFLGIEEFGTRLGSELVRFTPEGRDLERLRKEGGVSPEQYKSIITGDVSIGETVGSAAQLGLSLVLATGKLAVTGIKAGAKVGAAFGATEGIKEEKGVITKAVTGAVTGGIAGGLLQAASRGIQAVVSGKTAETLISKTLRQTPKDIALERAGKRPELAKQFLEKGLRGSNEGIIERASFELTKLEKQLQEHLARSQKTTIDTIRIIRSADSLVAQKRNVYGQKGVEIINEYKRFLLSKGNKILVQDAHRLVRDIYKELGDAAFNREILPQNKALLRTIAGALRKEIGRTSMVANKIIKEEQFYIRTIDTLERQINKQTGQNIFGLQDTIFAAGTLASGQPAVLGGAVLKRGLESTQIKTRAAGLLSQLGTIINKLPTDTAGRISKTAIFNAIKELQP